MSTLRALLSGLIIMLPGAALAHSGHGTASGLESGLLHPLTGLDHLLAMVAVGMLGAQIGRSAVWAMPLGFMSVMLIGGLIALAGVGLPAVEVAIMLSVLVLGGLLAWGRPLPQAAAVGLAMVFALFHGHAHGAEMPLATGALAYSLGFLATTGLLHGAGITLGLGLNHIGARSLARFAGCAIVISGIGLALV